MRAMADTAPIPRRDRVPLFLAAIVILIVCAVVACVVLEVLAPGDAAAAAAVRISAIVIPTITVLLARLQSHLEHRETVRALAQSPESPQ